MSFTYIEMSNNSLSKYYQDNKIRIQERARERH